jgi:hypothetical protein
MSGVTGRRMNDEELPVIVRRVFGHGCVPEKKKKNMIRKKR